MMHRVFPLEPARTLGYLTLLVWSGTGVSAQNPTIRATHVLGLEGISNNASGNLSIREDALQFRKGGGPAAQISIRSIEDVFLGTPPAVGRGAAPFGRGRVIGRLANRKYDTLTVEYLDDNDAVHGAIFELDKGQAQILRNQLVAEGAHVTQHEEAANTLEIKNDPK
jgi:hypothetical protein